jgi:hypothetical protein
MPVVADTDNPLLEHRNAFTDCASVDFQLGLTGTARCNSSSSTAAGRRPSKSGEPYPQLGQAWKQILQLCEFYLKLTFTGSGALRKNIQDQRCPINNLAPDALFKVALLGRREFIIKDDEIRALLTDDVTKLLNLPLAEKSPGFRMVQALRDHANHNGTCRHGQAIEFRQAFMQRQCDRTSVPCRRRVPGDVDSRQHGTFRACLRRSVIAFARSILGEACTPTCTST